MADGRVRYWTAPTGAAVEDAKPTSFLLLRAEDGEFVRTADARAGA